MTWALRRALALTSYWSTASGSAPRVFAAYDERLNIYPPNGEIPFSYLLGTTGAETTAALAQFGATLACMAGVFALSRRFGLDVHEAAFGALLFASLPIVVLQSTTTKNDLIVASPPGGA